MSRIFLNNISSHDRWFKPSRTQVATSVECKKREDKEQASSLFYVRNIRQNRPPFVRKTVGDISKPCIPQNKSLDPISQDSAKKFSHHMINYRHLSNWLSICNDNHAVCKPLSTPELGTINLIDVETNELVPYPTGKECQYIALSYVWGDTAPFPFRLGRLPDQTRATIDDAILVVKKLGLRYLWVDAICIDQHDGNHQMSQIRIMNLIYSGAYATIVALNGASANAGLPRVSQNSSSGKQSRHSFGPNQRVTTMPSLWHQILQSPWSKRGWTFQEALFSHRCLLFTKYQVYFNCNELHCSEAENDIPVQEDAGASAFLNSYLKSPKHFTRADRHNLLIITINGYIPRRLSYDGDALNAIAGILHHFEQELFPGGFHFGLPKHELRYYLGWIGGQDGAERQHARRASFPSWSWVGWYMKSPIDVREELAQEQPALTVWTNEGENLSQTLQLHDNTILPDSPSSCLPMIREILDMLKRKTDCNNHTDLKIPPKQTDETFLTIHGIICSMKILLDHGDLNSKDRCPQEGGIKCKLKSYKGTECEGIVYMTGNQAGFKSSSASEGSKLEFPSHPQDFLFLSMRSIRTEPCLPRATLLVLKWEKDIAYRQGVVYISGLPISTLLDCQPKVTEFLLG